MKRKLSLAQTPLIAASQAGAGTHPNNPVLGSAPSRAGKWFSAESHPSLHPVILTNYGNCLWMARINIPQSLRLRPPRDCENDGCAADGVSQNNPQNLMNLDHFRLYACHSCQSRINLQHDTYEERCGEKTVIGQKIKL